MRYCIDIETNGLLNTLDTVHCIVLKDIDSGKVISCFGKDYKELIAVIEKLNY